MLQKQENLNSHSFAPTTDTKDGSETDLLEAVVHRKKFEERRKRLQRVRTN